MHDIYIKTNIVGETKRVSYLGIEDARGPRGVVDADERVYDVCAIVYRYVVHGVPAYVGPVDGPVAEVADDFGSIICGHANTLHSRGRGALISRTPTATTRHLPAAEARLSAVNVNRDNVVPGIAIR